MSGTETTQRGRVRLFATGSCEGFDKLRESLASHPEIELVGSSTDVAGGAATLAGGHLAAVLQLPQLVENVVFAIRKATHTTRRHQESGASRHGKIVTVFSPKGGTGKTVTAANLATASAKYEGRK